MSSAAAQCLLSFLLLGAVLLATPSLADDELPPKPAYGPGRHPRGPCFRRRWGHGHPPGMPPFPEPVVGEGGLPPVGHAHALPPFFGPRRGRGHGPKFDPKSPHPPHAGALPPIPSWFGKGPQGPFHGGEDDDDCFQHFGAPAHAPHPHHPAAGDHHPHHPVSPASAPK